MSFSSSITYAAQAQSLVLKALGRLPRQPSRVPLWVPPCTFVTGRISVGNLYDELFCDQVYESPRDLPATPRIVDAGGHLGLASLYFLYRYPDCRLTTIEPNPALAALLRRNLARWQAQSNVIEAALSTRDGTVDFHITKDNPLNVTGGIDNREGSQRGVTRLQVPCVDAQIVLREHVDLMKLDVEGHEYELLQLELFNPSHIKNLIIEFHDIDQRSSEFDEVLRLLDERGYRVAAVDGVELHETPGVEPSGASVAFARLPQVIRGCGVVKFF